MFEDVVELDAEKVDLGDFEFVLGVQLYKTDEYGYVTYMQLSDGSTRLQQLPEPMQNAIPIYLPMIVNGN